MLTNFEIRGPDADDLVWLVLHGKGTIGAGMVNLGRSMQLVAQVALRLEEQRRATLSEGESVTSGFATNGE